MTDADPSHKIRALIQTVRDLHGRDLSRAEQQTLRRAADALFAHFDPYVVGTARRFDRSEGEAHRDELIAAGRATVFEAILKQKDKPEGSGHWAYVVDLDRNPASYVRQAIHHAMQRVLRSALGHSDDARKLWKQVGEAWRQLEQELERSPALDEAVPRVNEQRETPAAEDAVAQVLAARGWIPYDTLPTRDEGSTEHENDMWDEPGGTAPSSYDDRLGRILRLLPAKGPTFVMLLALREHGGAEWGDLAAALDAPPGPPLSSVWPDVHWALPDACAEALPPAWPDALALLAEPPPSSHAPPALRQFMRRTRLEIQSRFTAPAAAA